MVSVDILVSVVCFRGTSHISVASICDYAMFAAYHMSLTLSQTTNFRLFQTHEFADDNFNFDENGRKLSKQVENTGKRRNCSLRAICHFPTVFFQKTSTANR